MLRYKYYQRPDTQRRELENNLTGLSQLIHEYQEAITDYKDRIERRKRDIKRYTQEQKTTEIKLQTLPVVDVVTKAKKKYMFDREKLKANPNILAYKFVKKENRLKLYIITAPVVVDKFTKKIARQYAQDIYHGVNYFDQWYEERKPYMGFNLGRYAMCLSLTESNDQITINFMVSLDQSTRDYSHPAIHGPASCFGAGGSLLSKVSRQLSFNRTFNFIFDWLKFPFLRNPYMHSDVFVKENKAKVFPTEDDLKYWDTSNVIDPINSLLKEIK